MTKDTQEPAKEEVVIVDKHGKRHHGVAVLLDTDEVVRDKVGGFLGFLRERAVVGLAVGFVVATQVQSVVKVLISNFIDPAFKLWFGGSLDTRHFTLSFHGRHQNFGWGGVVYALLDFMFVVAAIYAIIKLFNLDELDKKPEKK